jgi:hypothetical protein
MKTVLFIESVHDILQQRLEEAGYACELRYQASREELLANASRDDGLY